MASTTAYDSTFFDPFAPQENKDHHLEQQHQQQAQPQYNNFVSPSAAGSFIPSPSSFSPSSLPSFAMPPKQNNIVSPNAGALVPYDVTQLQPPVPQLQPPPQQRQQRQSHHYNHDEISCISHSFSEDHGVSPTAAAAATTTTRGRSYTHDTYLNKENQGHPQHQLSTTALSNNYSNYNISSSATKSPSNQITGYAYDPRMSPMNSTAQLMSAPSTTSATSSSNKNTGKATKTSVSTDVMNKQHPMHLQNKKQRKRRTTGAAVGGVVVGGLTLGPVGMVLGGVGAAAATRKICKSKEKAQERAYEQQQVTKQALDPKRTVHAGSFA
eukprot:CAMPEP_0195290828 /NCGR_PEP_ID=MMETSP0707-20130614/6541_1 /TAXON_ID=33640 /ORGANISM="Asterionellopsis glacialis, Strain CCMP134" /LENGTH=324 /DNA_ID=CAMNT_0040351009 /DNA_START=157 /DNA_END=1131 /DNA_ORIENTATION=+